MRREFLDECKEKVFEFLEDYIDETYEDVSHMLDDARQYIADDYFYYNQGEYAYENYRDELGDQFSNHPDLYLTVLQNNPDLNPFSGEFALNVLRDAVVDMAVFMVEEIIPEEQYSQPITLDQKQIVSICEGLDAFDNYPYIDSYLYSTEFDDHYFQNEANKQFGLPLVKDAEEVSLEKSSIEESVVQEPSLSGNSIDNASSQSFDAEKFVSDQVDNALVAAADYWGYDRYSFCDEFIDIIAYRLANPEVNPKGFFEDLSYGGCVSGVVSELIYYDDTKRIYLDNMDSIDEFIEHLEDELGQKIELGTPRYNSAVWCAFEQFADRINCQLDLYAHFEKEMEPLSIEEKVSLLNYIYNDDIKEVIREQLDNDLFDYTTEKKVEVFNSVVGDDDKRYYAERIIEDLSDQEYTIERVEKEYPTLTHYLQAFGIKVADWLESAPEAEAEQIDMGNKKRGKGITR